MMNLFDVSSTVCNCLFSTKFFPNEQIIYIQNTTYMNVSEFVLKHVKYVPETESMLL